MEAPADEIDDECRWQCAWLQRKLVEVGHEVRREGHGRRLGPIPGKLPGNRRCAAGAVARSVATGQILGKRLSAGHTVQCVHGS